MKHTCYPSLINRAVHLTRGKWVHLLFNWKTLKCNTAAELLYHVSQHTKCVGNILPQQSGPIFIKSSATNRQTIEMVRVVADNKIAHLMVSFAVFGVNQIFPERSMPTLKKTNKTLLITSKKNTASQWEKNTYSWHGLCAIDSFERYLKVTRAYLG